MGHVPALASILTTDNLFGQAGTLAVTTLATVEAAVTAAAPTAAAIAAAVAAPSAATIATVVATAILATPANKLNTDASGNVVADNVGSGSATFVGPIIQGTTFTVEQGRDYLARDGMAIAWTIAWTGASLVGATAQMLLIPTSSFNSGATPTPITVTATITASGANWLLSTDISRTVTAAMLGSPPLGSATYTWEIVATLANGDQEDVISGKCTVNRQV
jgi:hypothetical protein